MTPAATGTEVLAISLDGGALQIFKDDEDSFELRAENGETVRELMRHGDLETICGLANELMWAEGQDAVDDVLERMLATSEPAYQAFSP